MKDRLEQVRAEEFVRIRKVAGEISVESAEFKSLLFPQSRTKSRFSENERKRESQELLVLPIPLMECVVRARSVGTSFE